MTADLIEAAVGLADLLARENLALRGLDLPGAAAMFEAKQRALNVFVAAQGALGAVPRPTGPAREVAERLGALADENRALLERAIAVQGRVLGTLARAAQPVASRYGARGGPAYDDRRTAIALSAKA